MACLSLRYASSTAVYIIAIDTAQGINYLAYIDLSIASPTILYTTLPLFGGSGNIMLAGIITSTSPLTYYYAGTATYITSASTTPAYTYNFVTDSGG